MYKNKIYLGIIALGLFLSSTLIAQGNYYSNYQEQIGSLFLDEVEASSYISWEVQAPEGKLLHCRTRKCIVNEGHGDDEDDIKGKEYFAREAAKGSGGSYSCVIIPCQQGVN